MLTIFWIKSMPRDVSNTDFTDNILESKTIPA